MSITFTNIFATVVYATDTNLFISHSTFTNNIGLILEAWYINVSIRHNKFIGNNGYATMCALHGMITNIDYSNFISNTGVLVAENTSLSISCSEFFGNYEHITVTVDVLGGMITNIDHSKFINNMMVVVAENTSVSISHSEFDSNNNIHT